MSTQSNFARGRPASQVSVTFDPTAPRPRVLIVLSGRVRGDDVVAAFLELYACEPGALFHDRLFDLTAYEGGFELAHLQQLSAAYRKLAGDNPPASRTAFVTHDPEFRSWTAVMPHQFPARAFATFYTLA